MQGIFLLRLCLAVALTLPTAWAQDLGKSDPKPQELATQIAAIEANAKLVQDRIGVTSGVDFNFTPESVKWLDGFIERTRTGVTNPAGLTQVLGSYFGEAIRKRYNCTWMRGGSLECDAGFFVHPFNKVSKQLANGSEDSIYSLYENIPALLAKHRDENTGTKKR